MPDSSPKEAATTCSTIHVVLDDMDREQAIRIVENLLYHAKLGDTMEGMSPGYVCIRPAGVRSPNNPIDRLRAAPAVLPGNPGSDWTPWAEREMQKFGAEKPLHAHDLVPMLAREILRLRAVNERHVAEISRLGAALYRLQA